jgi:hypothetical protein
LFKTIDDKFAELGFIKVEENCYGVIYERTDEVFKYNQVLHLVHKESGRHLIQSYDKNLFDTKKIGNTCVGLSMYEVKLCLKKMKKLGWKPLKI